MMMAAPSPQGAWRRMIANIAPAGTGHAASQSADIITCARTSQPRHTIVDDPDGDRHRPRLGWNGDHRDRL
jgi:hypothetical protein